MGLQPGTYAHQDRLRAHLLAELRDCEGQQATTKQLAGQVPDPWERRNGGDHYGAAWPQYVYPHLRAMESLGLIRRASSSDTRGVVWRLVTPGGVGLHVTPARR